MGLVSWIKKQFSTSADEVGRIEAFLRDDRHRQRGYHDIRADCTLIMDDEFMDDSRAVNAVWDLAFYADAYDDEWTVDGVSYILYCARLSQRDNRGSVQTHSRAVNSLLPDGDGLARLHNTQSNLRAHKAKARCAASKDITSAIDAALIQINGEGGSSSVTSSSVMTSSSTVSASSSS